MELQKALVEISEIRSHMARAAVFRGYRAVTVAMTGLLAVVTAMLQDMVVAEPDVRPGAYLVLWMGCGLLCVLLVGTEVLTRCRKSSSPLRWELTWMAIEQILPSLAAGGLLAAALYCAVPDHLWMLPGLWQILFSLGVFASARYVSPAAFFIGVFYLAAGIACLMLARGPWAYWPWAMGIPFGAGQLLSAAILHWNVGRRDAA